jgi:hypothetical protein
LDARLRDLHFSHTIFVVFALIFGDVCPKLRFPGEEEIGETSRCYVCIEFWIGRLN